eukprot:TRINITY_DN1148_c0_g2_i2.p1 TRINITY_DN1148_c0_g2~~TRINITY_DN1148_c0_g2_i2.p1  ORF type:complete len:287 (-),score=30.52 TRINITY_DN1148_c0_g2_i2:129-989(-)
MITQEYSFHPFAFKIVLFVSFILFNYISLSLSFTHSCQEPSTGLIPQGHSATVSYGVLSQALSVSRRPWPVLLALFFHAESGAYSVRPVPYQKLTKAEYAAALVPSEWPPAASVLGAGRTPAFVAPGGGFIHDDAAAAMEHRLAVPFLHTGQAPDIAQRICLALPLAQSNVPGVIMNGVVSLVHPLPTEGEQLEPIIGSSFFVNCKCGKPHPREEIIKGLGTLHGHKVEATVFLNMDDVGEVPALAGQWKAVLIANDNSDSIWELLSLQPLDRDLWLSEERKWRLH